MSGPFDFSVPAWTMRAKCASTDPAEIDRMDALFFPLTPGAGETDRNLSRDARRLCAKCPVQAECLQLALDTDTRFGVYGGTTPRMRRRIREAKDKTA